MKAYNFDLFVIGGGSGGLSAAKEAAELGASVGVADFVEPTPFGTKWGLGGTCVNVGCVPKKLIHYSALLAESRELFPSIGLSSSEDKQKHVWAKLIESVQLYIKKMNFGYRTQLKQKKIAYYNKLAFLLDKHTISLQSGSENEIVTADKVLIAVGGRPQYPEDVPGAQEYCITSDDLFSLKTTPGKTLCIGASYIALETAGFLSTLGYETSVMVRSILLRGFDQSIAERIGETLHRRGVRFFRSTIPKRVEKSSNGRLIVHFVNVETKEERSDEFDTVLLAIGRHCLVSKFVSPELGLKLDKSGKVLTDEAEQTSIENIFAIGDCAFSRPELTPPAIEAGRLLARRLFAKEKRLMDYNNVPTTIFTPIEYGIVGLSEEAAYSVYGKENVKVFHSEFTPLEWNLKEEHEDSAYIKIIVDMKNVVIGFHFLGPNAGEVTQGIAVAMKCGLTKDVLDTTVGIHPTSAEQCMKVETNIKEGDGKKTSC